MTAARDLADRFHARWLRANPFAATMYGIPGYDDLLPDASQEGQQAWRAEAGRFLAEATALASAPSQPRPADVITLSCVTEAAAQELATIDLAREDYTVSAMHYAGPAVFLSIAARTVLVDAAAAEAYLTRLRGSDRWLDQVTERLKIGASHGRLPVAPLAQQAVTWAENVLATPENSPVLVPRPPDGWRRAAQWEAERRAAATEVVHPAVARWLATVRELLPRARASAQAGLSWLPGGDADYARAIRAYTTLPLSAGELHQTGLAHVAALEERAVKLGEALGLSGARGGLRRAAGLRREGLTGGGDPPGGHRHPAGRGAGTGVVPRPAAAAVRGDAHAGRGGAGRRRAALFSAPAGWRAARDVLVQHAPADRGNRLGCRCRGLP